MAINDKYSPVFFSFSFLSVHMAERPRMSATVVIKSDAIREYLDLSSVSRQPTVCGQFAYIYVDYMTRCRTIHTLRVYGLAVTLGYVSSERNRKKVLLEIWEKIEKSCSQMELKMR